MTKRLSGTMIPCLFVLTLASMGCVRPPAPGDPVAGLTPAERKSFQAGRQLFAREFTPETGLGPLFNEVACGACHEDPALGGGGDEIEIHATRQLPDGFCDPLADRGGPIYQLRVTPALQSALEIDREPIPSEATGRGSRSSPDIFGFGLLDAVPEAEILARADPEDRNHDGISGRPNRFVDGRLGRFGRKAFVPTLAEFTAGAFSNEQGITTPEILDEGTVGGTPIPPGVDPTPEPELDARNLALVEDFVRFLAPPSPAPSSSASRKGETIFGRIGCAACHVPFLKTGPSPSKALAYRKVPAYSDLLLHDMGPDFADICLGLAGPSEFRTEPLMGLRLSKRFLHDGRASSIEEAIQAHAGEAGASRDHFKALSAEQRAALLAFLKTL